jgi:hypothetical protein
MRSPPSPEGQPRRLHTPRRARQEVVETAEPLTDGDTPSPVKAANGSAGDAGVTDGQQPQAAKTELTSAEVARLAELPLLKYAAGERLAAAKRFAVPANMLDKLVEAERKKAGGDDDGKQGRAVKLPEPEPSPEPVDGEALLTDVSAAMRR